MKSAVKSADGNIISRLTDLLSSQSIVRTNMRSLYTILIPLLLAACSSDKLVNTEPVKDNRTSVNITTRAEEGDNTTGLLAGLYMVNYQNGNPDELLPANNYVNNQLLSWDKGTWQTATPIYWNDMDTQADFYAYAPYMSGVADARNIPFQVSQDQRSEEAFAKSDLLWGTVLGQMPTSGDFELTLQHLLSRLTVNVTADTGFDEGELRAEDVNVTIGGTLRAATFDAMTAALTLVEGSVSDVICHSNGNLSYTAILLPQQVPFTNLIQVDWKGNKYTLQNNFTLEARKQYTLTVKLKKTKSGFDIGIEGWDILPDDFGGAVGG